MIPLLFISLMLLLGITAHSNTSSQLDRMSLAFGVANRPYEPAPKPKGKGTKDKFMHLMARAKYAGTGVVGLSGKIAGTVFLSNGVVRVWSKPNNVRNTFTQFVRGVFSGTSTSWKTLTATQIATWITAAPLYFSRKVFATAHALKGNTLFQKVNNTLTTIGIANIATAPGIATPPYVITAITTSSAMTVPTLHMLITEFNGGVALPTGSYLKVYATRQVDIGKSSFSPSSYRLIGVFPPTTATNPLDALADYTARFGTLIEGQRIGLAVETITYLPDGVGGFNFGASGKFYTETVVAH